MPLHNDPGYAAIRAAHRLGGPAHSAGRSEARSGIWQGWEPEDGILAQALRLSGLVSHSDAARAAVRSEGALPAARLVGPGAERLEALGRARVGEGHANPPSAASCTAPARLTRVSVGRTSIRPGRSSGQSFAQLL